MGDVITQIVNGFGDLAAKLAHKESPNKIEIISETEQAADDLYKQLFKLIEDGEICTAENKLFQEIKKSCSNAAFDVAAQFYARLDDFSESHLQAHNFSKQEIQDGITAINKIKSSYNY